MQTGLVIFYCASFQTSFACSDFSDVNSATYQRSYRIRTPRKRVSGSRPTRSWFRSREIGRLRFEPVALELRCRCYGQPNAEPLACRTWLLRQWNAPVFCIDCLRRSVSRPIWLSSTCKCALVAARTRSTHASWVSFVLTLDTRRDAFVCAQYKQRMRLNNATLATLRTMSPSKVSYENNFHCSNSNCSVPRLAIVLWISYVGLLIKLSIRLYYESLRRRSHSTVLLIFIHLLYYHYCKLFVIALLFTLHVVLVHLQSTLDYP